MAMVDIAGMDNAAPYGRKTLQEWTNQHDVARVDIAGGKKRVQVSLTETVLYYT